MLDIDGGFDCCRLPELSIRFIGDRERESTLAKQTRLERQRHQCAFNRRINLARPSYLTCLCVLFGTRIAEAFVGWSIPSSDATHGVLCVQSTRPSNRVTAIYIIMQAYTHTNTRTYGHANIVVNVYAQRRRRRRT